VDLYLDNDRTAAGRVIRAPRRASSQRGIGNPIPGAMLQDNHGRLGPASHGQGRVIVLAQQSCGRIEAEALVLGMCPKVGREARIEDSRAHLRSDDIAAKQKRRHCQIIPQCVTHEVGLVEPVPPEHSAFVWEVVARGATRLQDVPLCILDMHIESIENPTIPLRVNRLKLGFWPGDLEVGLRMVVWFLPLQTEGESRSRESHNAARIPQRHGDHGGLCDPCVSALWNLARFCRETR